MREFFESSQLSIQGYILNHNDQKTIHSTPTNKTILFVIHRKNVDKNVIESPSFGSINKRVECVIL